MYIQDNECECWSIITNKNIINAYNEAKNFFFSLNNENDCIINTTQNITIIIEGNIYIHVFYLKTKKNSLRILSEKKYFHDGYEENIINLTNFKIIDLNADISKYSEHKNTNTQKKINYDEIIMNKEIIFKNINNFNKYKYININKQKNNNCNSENNSCSVTPLNKSITLEYLDN